MVKKEICGFEIFIMIMGIVSFAFFVGQIDYGNSYERNDFDLRKVLDFFSVVPSVSAQSLDGILNSQGKCCLETNAGSSCIDLGPGDEEQCAGDLLSSSCSQVSQCNLGCGFDTSEGLCTPNTAERECDESENCEFFDSPLCEVNECQKGCYVVGSNAYFVTQKRAEILSQRQGLPLDFKEGIEDELSCVEVLEEETKGACVFGGDEEGNLCKFTTKSECEGSIEGDFYEDYLCSNPELNTICEKQETTNCVENLDGVYWFDSCGNRENIYSSDKDRSWNDGMVLDADESCNPNSANADSASCGNCDYNLGSVCGEYKAGQDKKPTYGNFVCKDLNCYDAPDNGGGETDRLNGESWCVFDGPIGSGSLLGGSFSNPLSGIINSSNRESVAGDGGGGALSGLLGGFSLDGEIGLMSTDLVGSRHFRYICDKGEVKVEPCADYRKEVCVQNDKTLESGEKVDEALCRVNMWEQCLALNGGGLGGLAGGAAGGGSQGTQATCGADCIPRCVSNPDCRVQATYVDEDFWFATCVPKYPPGFDLGSTTGLGQLAGGFGGDFAGDALGDLGGGLGDIASQAAGSLGGGTQASEVCGIGSQTCTSIWQKLGIPPFCKWECVENCNCHEAGFTLQMNNLCTSLGDCGVYTNIAGNPGMGGASVSKDGNHGKTPPQPFVLFPLYIAVAKLLGSSAPSGGFFNEESGLLELPLHGISAMFGGSFSSVTPGGLGDVGRGRFGDLFSSNQLGGTLGSMVFTAGGTQLLASSTLTLGTIGTSTGTFGLPLLSAGPLMFDPVSLAIFVVTMALIAFSGCGKIEAVEINFECKPWQPPAGSGLLGKGCEACNEDPLKPCTEYRCSSLGTGCQLIKENTGEDTCVAIEGEDTIPVITPWEDILNKSKFSYTDASTNGFRVRDSNGECIDAFTPIVFGVETDVFATCRWATESKPFEEMTETFLETKGFSKNHTLYTKLPSVNSLIAGEVGDFSEIDDETYEQVSGELGELLADMNIYVKCANINGDSQDHDYRVNFCVEPGPDLTLPVVVATSPPENAKTAFNATSQDVKIYVNEPAECRWDTVRPTETGLEGYNKLRNSMDCDTSLNQGSLIGYECSSTLSVENDENNYYFLCRDQPWFGEGTGKDGEERNFGAKEGSYYEYNLERSGSELVVDSISPEGTITAGEEPISVDIEVGTSGGGYSGEAVCEYSLDDGLFIQFYDTNANSHKQVLNSMSAGEHNVKVKCVDEAGNIASGETNFVLELDTTPPKVTRAYYDSGSLVVLTNEDSICYYDNKTPGCGFGSNVTKMSGSNSKRQSASWEIGEDYYIKCEDIWGNSAGGCSIEIKPYEAE